MKKSLPLFILLLCITTSIVNGAGRSKKTGKNNWILTPNGKFYFTRFDEFYDGVERMGHNNWASAAKCNRNSLTTTWKFNYPAYNNYGVAVGMLSDFDQAVGLFKLSIQTGGNADIARFNVFITYMNQKKYEDAIQLLKIIPSYIQDIYPEEIGTCCVLNKQYFRGFELLKQYIQTDSNNVSDVTYYNESVAAWVLKDTVSAIENINKAINENGKNFNYYLHKGKIFLNINPAISVNSFLKAKNLAPQDKECLTGLGYAYIAYGDGKKAKDVFKKLIKKGYSNDPDIYQGLAIALGQCSEFDNALDAMHQVSKKRTLNQFDNRILGDIWLNKDSIDYAIGYYNVAMTKGFDPDAAIGLAICFFLKDQTEDAFDMISSIELVRPDYKLSDYGVFLKAMIYYRKGFFDQFSAEIDHSFFGRSKEVSKLMIMAMKSIVQFQYIDAEKYLHKAIRLEPDNINLQLISGTLNFQTGNYAKAVAIFKQANKQDPENIEIKNSLALALSEAGQRDDAISMMLEVIRKEPKARYYNNMALVLTNEARDKKQPYDEVCGYYETGILYVDSALKAGASPSFAINKGNLYYELHDTANANKYYFDSATPFSTNNIAVMSYLQNEIGRAITYIDKAVNESKEHICPTINYNQEVINYNSMYSGNKSIVGPKFIYLFQVMPGILPSHHVFSYSFKMNDNAGLQVNGRYIVYTTLQGDNNMGKPVKGNQICLK